MLTNTDDAYGFPPFRYLAPAISIGSQDYHELRATERNILAGFLANVRVRTLASDTFSWADEIPHLIVAKNPGSAGASANGASDRFSWAEESSRLMGVGDSRSCWESGNGASGNGHGAPRTVAPPGPGRIHLGNGVKPHGNHADAGLADAGHAEGTRPATPGLIRPATGPGLVPIPSLVPWRLRRSRLHRSRHDVLSSAGCFTPSCP